MKGLSSGMLAKTQSLAQAKPSCAAVSSAARLMVRPELEQASMLMPARVEATLTEAHTRSVVASASGMASISARSPAGHALLDQGREPADEVHVHLASGGVQRARKLDHLRPETARRPRPRSG